MPSPHRVSTKLRYALQLRFAHAIKNVLLLVIAYCRFAMIILRLPDGTCRLASLPTPCSGDTVVMAAATMCGVTRDAVYALHDVSHCT